MNKTIIIIALERHLQHEIINLHQLETRHAHIEDRSYLKFVQYDLINKKELEIEEIKQQIKLMEGMQ